MKNALTPKAIVAALDEHIIGQADAKRAVAVALRNRWRRQRLSPELRDEVTPKNILMIGPTGCGKTEISRRLAKLADAPFVKVEATKFTEVGYVGRDVDSIILMALRPDLTTQPDARLAELVDLKFFAGLTFAEIAAENQKLADLGIVIDTDPAHKLAADAAKADAAKAAADATANDGSGDTTGNANNGGDASS